MIHSFSFSICSCVLCSIFVLKTHTWIDLIFLFLPNFVGARGLLLNCVFIFFEAKSVNKLSWVEEKKKWEKVWKKQYRALSTWIFSKIAIKLLGNNSFSIYFLFKHTHTHTLCVFTHREKIEKKKNNFIHTIVWWYHTIFSLFPVLTTCWHFLSAPQIKWFTSNALYLDI